MKLSRERIDLLSRTIARELLHRHFISSEVSEGELAGKVGRLITEDQVAEDRLDAEVREMMKAHESEIRKGEGDFQKMFLLIKKKLAKERGIVL